jgi:hypothetical protein
MLTLLRQYLEQKLLPRLLWMLRNDADESVRSKAIYSLSGADGPTGMFLNRLGFLKLNPPAQALLVELDGDKSLFSLLQSTESVQLAVKATHVLNNLWQDDAKRWSVRWSGTDVPKTLMSAMDRFPEDEDLQIKVFYLSLLIDGVGVDAHPCAKDRFVLGAGVANATCSCRSQVWKGIPIEFIINALSYYCYFYISHHSLNYREVSKLDTIEFSVSVLIDGSVSVSRSPLAPSL